MGVHFQATRNRVLNKAKNRSSRFAVGQYVHVILLLLAIFVQPDFFCIFSKEYEQVQCHLAAYAMIAIWVHFMLVIGKSPDMGIYIALFQRMTSIFLVFLWNYVWIIFGSGFSLYLAFQKTSTNSADEGSKNNTSLHTVSFDQVNSR
jgi:hypothetical protein